jgi:hypothetical protein
MTQTVLPFSERNGRNAVQYIVTAATNSAIQPERDCVRTTAVIERIAAKVSIALIFWLLAFLIRPADKIAATRGYNTSELRVAGVYRIPQ